MALLIIIAVIATTFSVWMLIIILKAFFERWLDKDKEYYHTPVDIEA